MLGHPPGLSVNYLPGRASCKSTPISVRLELLRKEVASQSLMPASQLRFHLLGALLVDRRIVDRSAERLHRVFKVHNS